jgi:Helix-turn-helix domain
MSIRLTSAAWDLSIGSTEKFVLMCLCDHANDDGMCWPSVARICEKVSKSERTVQTALKWLSDEGYFTVRDGVQKSRTYQLDPRKICTPQISHPATFVEKHAKVAPHPRKFRTQTIIEPSEPLIDSKESISARAKIDCPAGVEKQVWDDFAAFRKAKRAPLSQTALDGIIREAGKIGWTLNDALSECVTRGWQGFKADWIKDRKNGTTNRTSDSTTGLGRTFDAGQRAYDILKAQEALPRPSG